MTGEMRDETILPRRPQSDPGTLAFLVDTVNLFTGESKGHMGAYLYSSSQYTSDPVQGSRLWAEFRENSRTFYMRNADVVVHNMGLKDIRNHVEPGASVIDLGPGTAGEDITIPTLRTLQAKEWHGLDRCVDFLVDTEQKIHTNLPSVTTFKHKQDIFSPLNVLDLGSTAYILFSGGTVANLPFIPDKPEFPKREYVSLLRNLRQVDAKKTWLFLPFDTNSNPASIVQSYQDPRYATWVENLPHRIQRDLCPRNFNPKAFKYEPIWDQDRLLLAHTLTSTIKQKFRLASYEFTIQKGQRYYINNSYKIPAKLMEEVATTAGWSVEKACHAPQPQTYSALLLARNGVKPG